MARVKPATVAPERKQLRAFLDYQRATLLWKIEGLDDEQLRRVMVPSGLTLLGLVKHLAEVEHGWFVLEFAKLDEPYLYYSPEDEEADFRIDPSDTTEAIVSAFDKACQRSREIEAAAESLDVTFEQDRRGTIDLRWLMLHMIEEYARHNGHADILREQIDGATGD